MEEIQKTDWPVVSVAVLGGIVAALYVGKVPPALSFIQTDMGFDLVQGGYVISIFNLLGMVTAMLIGTAVDQFDRRLLILLSFGLLSFGGLVGSFSDSLSVLLLSRVIEGSGFICIAVAMPAVVIASSSAKDRPLAISLWSIFTPTGMALALIFFPYLEGTLNWRGIWQMLSFLPVLVCVAVFFLFRDIPIPIKTTRNPFELVLQTLSQKGLWLIALSFGGYVLQWVSLMVWLPTFLRVDLSFEKGEAAFLTALIIAMNIPSNIMGGWLLRKGLNARVLIIIGSLFMAAMSVAIFVLPLDAYLQVLCCFLFSLIGGGIPACLFAYTPKYAPSPSHMSASSGMLMQGSSLGQFIGPPLLAYAVSLGGGNWSNAVYPMIVGAMVTLISGWFVTKGK